jgi:protease I
VPGAVVAIVSAMSKRLSGLRVAVLAADGVEQVEYTIPARALRKAGADVRLLSLRPGRIRSVNFLWRGRKFPVDQLVEGAHPEDYGALLLPGGFVNPDLMRQSQRARDFVRDFDALGRPIAVICHGAETMVSAGMVEGRRLTSWPGIADDLRNAGAHWVNAPLVRDGRWVSSRGPQDLRSFITGMIDLFEAEGVRDLPRLGKPVRWVARLAGLAPWGVIAAIAFGKRLGAAADQAGSSRRSRLIGRGTVSATR